MMNIKDIAKLAGVSASTVSKIINNKDQTISKETRERVLKIVRDYNYTPYSANLVTNSTTKTFVLLLNSHETFEAWVTSFIDKAQENGYNCLILNSHGSLEQELKNITSPTLKQASGIIWDPINENSKQYAKFIEELTIPYYFVNHSTNELPSLAGLYEEASYVLTQELLQNNHKKISYFVTNPKYKEAIIAGYKKALFDVNLPFSKENILTTIPADFSNQLITDGITGILTDDYTHAVFLEQLLKQSGLRTPDNYSLLAIKRKIDRSFLPDHISSVLLDTETFGSQLALLLLNKRKEKTALINEAEKLVLDHKNTLGMSSVNPHSKMIVVGSLNVDNYLYSTNLPHNGKTNFLSSYAKFPGGKGLNQAVGLTKLGHQATLIGCLGSDTDANYLYKELEKYHVTTDGITRIQDTETGQAYIYVETSGDSMISILPGANTALTPKKIAQQKHLFMDASFCLIQTEIPLSAVKKACEIAQHSGVPIILKPAAIHHIPVNILEKVDFFIPNEDELLELQPDTGTLEEKAAYFLEMGVKNVIVTLGKKGVLLKTHQVCHYFPATENIAVDSTGASDSFISALASYLSKGYPTEAAIQIAIQAAGFSVSKEGVIDSLVDHVTLENYLIKKEPALFAHRNTCVD